MHVSFLDFKRLIKCQTICNHFPPSSLGLTTVDQGHLTVTQERSCALPPFSCSACVCLCVWWSSTVWPDMAVHFTRSQGQKPGVGNAKSYFPKPTRPHPAQAHTNTHTQPYRADAHDHSHKQTFFPVCELTSVS